MSVHMTLEVNVCMNFGLKRHETYSSLSPRALSRFSRPLSANLSELKMFPAFSRSLPAVESMVDVSGGKAESNNWARE